jgi:hypothetical protein
MSYGDPEWQAWVLLEQEGIAQIKAAYDLGINAFDTANVGFVIFSWCRMVADATHAVLFERPVRGDPREGHQATQHSS